MTLAALVYRGFVVIWGIGGIIGGIVTALVIHHQEPPTFFRNNVIATTITWTVAFVLGGFVGTATSAILRSTVRNVIGGPLGWGWGVIPDTIALAVTGAIAGAVGGKMTLMIMESTGRA